MSGLEIAGLALSALPLGLPALGEFKKAKRACKDWWRFERTYRRIWNILSRQELCLKLPLEKLILPLVVGGILDENEREALLAHPQGPKWRAPDTQSALEKRLAGAYEPYLQCFRDFFEAVTGLLKLLGVDKPAFRIDVSKRLVSCQINI